jgi:thiamine-phosphate pyrophosphorylase
MVQLREKDLSIHELSILAKWLLPIIREYDAKLLINASPCSKTLEGSKDLVEMAGDIKADGVHLGHASISPKLARDLLGPGKLIGYSTHSPEEARKAEAEGADFITLSPIFKIKKPGLDPIGTQPITTAAKMLKIPLFALGGIDLETVGAVMGAGAYGVAVISAIFCAEDITGKTKALISKIRGYMENKGSTVH